MIPLRTSPILALLQSAGDLILSHYRAQDFEVDIKSDDSPVTTADKESNELIISGLKDLYPDIPIISEESTQVAYSIRKDWEYCWMVDPLDGTKEFLKQNGEFSINLALIHQHRPIAGFIHFPVLELSYLAQENKGAWKINPDRSMIQLRPATLDLPKSKIRVLISRSHAGQHEYQFVDQVVKLGFPVETLAHGSAYKHCLLAEGRGDVYPKFGICSEWDTAPGQIILEEAGGIVTRTDTRQPLRYNKPDFSNPEFIMWGTQMPTALQQSLLDSGMFP